MVNAQQIFSQLQRLSSGDLDAAAASSECASRRCCCCMRRAAALKCALRAARFCYTLPINALNVASAYVEYGAAHVPVALAGVVMKSTVHSIVHRMHRRFKDYQ